MNKATLVTETPVAVDRRSTADKAHAAIAESLIKQKVYKTERIDISEKKYPSLTATAKIKEGFELSLINSLEQGFSPVLICPSPSFPFKNMKMGRIPLRKYSDISTEMQNSYFKRYPHLNGIGKNAFFLLSTNEFIAFLNLNEASMFRPFSQEAFNFEYMTTGVRKRKKQEYSSSQYENSYFYSAPYSCLSTTPRVVSASSHTSHMMHMKREAHCEAFRKKWLKNQHVAMLCGMDIMDLHSNCSHGYGGYTFVKNNESISIFAFSFEATYGHGMYRNIAQYIEREIDRPRIGKVTVRSKSNPDKILLDLDLSKQADVEKYETFKQLTHIVQSHAIQDGLKHHSAKISIRAEEKSNTDDAVPFVKEFDFELGGIVPKKGIFINIKREPYTPTSKNALAFKYLEWAFDEINSIIEADPSLLNEFTKKKKEKRLTPKQKMEIAKKQYVDNCLIQFRTEKDKLTKTEKSLRERHEHLLTQLMKSSSDIEIIHDKQEQIETTLAIKTSNTIEKQWENLLSLSKVDQVISNEKTSTLYIGTKPLFCRDSRSGILHLIGKIQITLPMNKNMSFIKYKPLDVLNCLGRTKRRHIAPHVPISGGPCYGNVGAVLTQLIGENRYAEAVGRIISYLQSANVKDTWGKGVHSWPWIDENNKTFIKGFEKGATEGEFVKYLADNNFNLKEVLQGNYFYYMRQLRILEPKYLTKYSKKVLGESEEMLMTHVGA
jgi:hypothetical protein